MSLYNSSDYEHLIRLVRLARALEMGGNYNAAKLCWAAAYAHEIETSGKAGVPTDAGEIAAEIDKVAAALEANGADAAFIKGLKIGREAVQKKTGIPISEIPPVHVCRNCGQIALGAAPEQCPRCGAWELTFKEIPPVHYLEPLPPARALESLASAPDLVAGMIDGLDDEQMRWQPAPEEWGIRGVLVHMWMSHELLAGRMIKMLAEDNPSLKAAMPNELSGMEQMGGREVFEKFRASRADTVERLTKISPEDWWRTGQHEEFGTVTILQQASYFAKHDHAHLTQIRKILDAMSSNKRS